MCYRSIRSILALALCSSATAQADLVRYTFTGNVNVAASPFLGGTFELRAQFDLGTAPSLTMALPDENRYSINALSHWLKISGAPDGNGIYTANSPVVFGLQDELPPSTDPDSMTYDGIFTTSIGDVEIRMITFFANPNVLANVENAPPVFNPTDAFLIVMTHTLTGTEYNLAAESVNVEIFPDGTGIPELSSLGFGLVAVLATGWTVRSRSRRK